MALCVLLFLRQFPILPLSDPLFLEMLQASHGQEGDRGMKAGGIEQAEKTGDGLYGWQSLRWCWE